MMQQANRKITRNAVLKNLRRAAITGVLVAQAACGGNSRPAQVEIKAPGYRPYKSVVQLRAGGDLREHSFALERERETP